MASPDVLSDSGIAEPIRAPPPRTFRRWLKEPKVLEAIQSSMILRPDCRRDRPGDFPEVEAALRKYMDETGERNKEVLKEKAKELAARVLPPERKFCGSNAWFSKFLERYGERQVDLPAIAAIQRSPLAAVNPTPTPNQVSSMEAMDCVIKLSNYADAMGNDELKNSVARVSLAMAKIQHSQLRSPNASQQT